MISREFDIINALEQGLLSNKLLNILDQENNIFKWFCSGPLFYAIADGQRCFDNIKFAIVEEVVPDPTWEVELENVRVKSNYPLKQEYATAEPCLLKDFIQLWQLFLHQTDENVENNVDFVHVKTVKIEEDVFPIHDVGKYGECF